MGSTPMYHPLIPTIHNFQAARSLFCYHLINNNKIMETTPDEFKQIITEIIKKQSVILGPQIAILKARNIQGLKISDDGTVSDVDGNGQEILQRLIEEYVALSGEIVKNTVNSVFAKYPSLKS